MTAPRLSPSGAQERLRLKSVADDGDHARLRRTLPVPSDEPSSTAGTALPHS